MTRKSQKVLIFLALIGFLATELTAHAQYYGAQPIVQTGSVTSLTQSGGTLMGTINPNGYPANYYFEYGPTLSFGITTPTQAIGNSNNTISVSAAVYNLNANTLYYYRLVAQGQTGSAVGQTLSFTTGSTASGTTAPMVDTNAAANITNISATLLGYVRSSLSNNSYGWFEYGTSAGYLNLTTPSTYIGSSSYYNNYQNYSSIFSAVAANLQPGTTYYFRAALKNDAGIAYGQTLTFITTGGTYSAYTNPYASTAGYYGSTNQYPYYNSTYPYYGTTYNSSYPYSNSYPYSSTNYNYSYPYSTTYPYTSYTSATYPYSTGASYPYGYGGGASATTNPAGSITQNSAVVYGQINLGPSVGAGWFEYGSSPSFGSQTSQQQFSYLGGTNQLTGTLTNLQSGTTYYYRTVGSSSTGTFYGSTLTFQTQGTSYATTPTYYPTTYTPTYTSTYTPAYYQPTTYATTRTQPVTRIVYRNVPAYINNNTVPSTVPPTQIAYGQTGQVWYGVAPGQVGTPAIGTAEYAAAVGAPGTYRPPAYQTPSASQTANIASSTPASSLGFIGSGTFGFILLALLVLLILWTIFRRS